jgi:diguanylate cyclase (GGDEF)-like protein
VLVPVWRSGSIRTWIGIGILAALSPLLLSAFTGHLILDRDVIPLLQAHSRRHDRIDPAQRLRLLIWSSISPVEGLNANGSANDVQTYKTIQARIAEEFAVLRPRVQADPELSALFAEAQKDWIEADSHASEAMAARRGGNNWQQLATFHQHVAAADESLSAALEKLAADGPESQDSSIDVFNHFKTVVYIFAAVSIVACVVLFFLMSQIISSSTKRLVDAAQQFAAGARDQQVTVRVPPDLHGVLEELNRSISRTHEAESTLANRANRDGLTDLLNRRAFDEALAGFFARKQRFGEPFALLLLDLDHFKSINDTYGHGAGDEVLRVIAGRMMTDLRPFDTVFRVGGEEFAVLVSGVDSAEARQIGNRVLHVIASHPIPLPVEALYVTASIGVVTDAAGSDTSTLYAAADAALYHAKTTGRNRVVVGERAYSSTPQENQTT